MMRMGVGRFLLDSFVKESATLSVDMMDKSKMSKDTAGHFISSCLAMTYKIMSLKKWTEMDKFSHFGEE